MNINEYSSIDFSKPNILSPGERFTPKFIEQLLLIIIAILGIIGSLYVFTMSSNYNNSPNYHNLSVVAASTSDLNFDDLEGKTKFKDYFKIEGKKKVGETLFFTFKKDRKETRYVLDMGNGERVIITSDEFPYKFNKPGKYLLELKTIKRGLISTIATLELKVKD